MDAAFRLPTLHTVRIDMILLRSPVKAEELGGGSVCVLEGRKRMQIRLDALM